MRPALRSGPPNPEAPGRQPNTSPSTRSTVVKDATSARGQLRHGAGGIPEREQGRERVAVGRAERIQRLGLLTDRHGGQHATQSLVACGEEHAPRERVHRRGAGEGVAVEIPVDGRQRAEVHQQREEDGDAVEPLREPVRARRGGDRRARRRWPRPPRAGRRGATTASARRRVAPGTRTSRRDTRRAAGGGSPGPSRRRRASPGGSRRSARSGRRRARGRVSRRPPARR